MLVQVRIYLKTIVNALKKKLFGQLDNKSLLDSLVCSMAGYRYLPFGLVKILQHLYQYPAILHTKLSNKINS